MSLEGHPLLWQVVCSRPSVFPYSPFPGSISRKLGLCGAMSGAPLSHSQLCRTMKLVANLVKGLVSSLPTDITFLQYAEVLCSGSSLSHSLWWGIVPRYQTSPNPERIPRNNLSFHPFWNEARAVPVTPGMRGESLEWVYMRTWKSKYKPQEVLEREPGHVPGDLGCGPGSHCLPKGC